MFTFGFLITTVLVQHLSLADEIPLYTDADSYPLTIKAVQELNFHQWSEDLGTEYAAEEKQRPTSVCYDEFGCFDKNGTFKHLKLLPEPPETIDTKFLLYTRKNLLEPQFLDYKKPETVLDSNINPSLPLKIIIHGFGGKGNSTWVWEMKDAFLEKEDVNVIVVDWSFGARIPTNFLMFFDNYMQATVNTELIGAQATVFYFFLKDKLGIPEKNLHLLGFSLGAHVAGFIGKKMQEFRGTKPSRITGLDPASPFFEDYGESVHLFKDDADFVDVLHTNADSVYYGGVGIEKPIGHVDYYPNGGKRQPGCESTIKGAIMDVFKGKKEKVCNHERAVHLFIHSILERTSCEYTGYRCDNYEDFTKGKCLSCNETCGRMGYKPSGSGIYYLMTTAKPPFCAGMAKLHVKFPTDVKKTYGKITVSLIDSKGTMHNITVTDKEQKLEPGAEKVQAMVVNEVVKNLSSVQVLYERYYGFFGLTKGSKTFALASVSIVDTSGAVLFNSCKEYKLTDNVYVVLEQTENTC